MAGPWSVMDPLAASSSSSTSSDNSHSDSDSHGAEEAKDNSAASQEKKGLKKDTLDFEAISKHGYSGGPSVLYVPPPKPIPSEEGQDWSWSCGKRKGEDGKADEQLEESLAQRNETWHTTNTGAVQAAAQAIAEYNHAKKQRQEAAAEAKALSFAQKEKRKRDFGQASRVPLRSLVPSTFRLPVFLASKRTPLSHPLLWLVHHVLWVVTLGSPLASSPDSCLFRNLFFYGATDKVRGGRVSHPVGNVDCTDLARVCWKLAKPIIVAETSENELHLVICFYADSRIEPCYVYVHEDDILEAIALALA